MSAVKKGDTLIEVVLSFVMFSLVAAVSIAVMHAGISGAEAAIELTLARVEIDSQSETMRFIQESFANDLAYKLLWDKITEGALPIDAKLPSLDTASCSNIYSADTSDIDVVTLSNANAFILNPRRIVDEADENNKKTYYAETLVTGSDKFSPSSLNPRVIYTTESDENSQDADTTDDSLIDDSSYNTIFRAEGIYDFLVKDVSASEGTRKPSHYDFYVYTCWFTPGAERPTTIGTVSRLYNPEFLDE